MSIVVTGVKEILRVIGKAKAETGKRIEDGIRQCCEVILKRAYVYCPKATTALAQSGAIYITGKGFGCRGSIVFGGPAAPYGIYVHENLFAYHEPPTQAKFLERASRELRGTCTNIMKRTIISGTYRVIDSGEAGFKESDVNQPPEE